MLNLNTILALFGGIPGVVANVVTALTKGKTDLTASGIDAGADRILTISEKDHKAICKKLGIKDSDDIAEGLDLARKAGDHGGNYLAFLTKKAAKIED